MLLLLFLLHHLYLILPSSYSNYFPPFSLIPPFSPDTPPSLSHSSSSSFSLYSSSTSSLLFFLLFLLFILLFLFIFLLYSYLLLFLSRFSKEALPSALNSKPGAQLYSLTHRAGLLSPVCHKTYNSPLHQSTLRCCNATLRRNFWSNNTRVKRGGFAAVNSTDLWVMVGWFATFENTVKLPIGMYQCV